MNKETKYWGLHLTGIVFFTDPGGSSDEKLKIQK